MGGVENIEDEFGNRNVSVPAGICEHMVSSPGISVVPQRLQVDQASQNLAKDGGDYGI
jgi:hypothetical protein